MTSARNGPNVRAVAFDLWITDWVEVGKPQNADEDVIHGKSKGFVPHCHSTALDFTLKAPLERAAL